jgi:hypothetical protein
MAGGQAANLVDQFAKRVIIFLPGNPSAAAPKTSASSAEANS